MYRDLLSKLCSVALTLLLVMLSFSAYSGPVTDYGQLQVQGNKIVSASTGEPVQLKGYSTHGLQWFPYVTGTGGTVENMVNDFNVQVIRLAMYVKEWDLGRQNFAGYLGEHANIYEEQVRPLILDAIANDIYVIVDWHIHWNNPTTANPHWTAQPYTDEAKTFFNMVATEFGSHPNVIYEIMNEPGHDISWSQIKAHAYSVYDEIRAIDSDNLILVPSPNWSQDILTPSQDPLNGVENVAYTMHFYAQSHNFRSAAEQALDNGIAIWVSEWGMSDFTGNGQIDTSENGTSDLWVDWMRDRNISWLAWNFANKSESSSALKEYTQDDGLNETLWGNNETLDGVAMQSGPWPDEVIKESGKWIRDRINEGVSTPCTTDCNALVQAEDYSEMSGIQTEPTADEGGGENVGYIDPDDWMIYSVNVPTTGSYTVSYRIASITGGSLKIEKSGGSVLYGEIDLPATDGWQNWQTVSHTVNLTAGQQHIGIASSGGAWNINWFTLTSNNSVVADSDNDGVIDGHDHCPQTPVGVVVDASGCEVIILPSDDDNDGVMNEHDLCPNTPTGTSVDANGCEVIILPSDDDNDGVINEHDLCPNTPTGTNVDVNGCAVVTDNCAGINAFGDWLRKDWAGGEPNHHDNGDMMLFEGNAYVANWYTNSVPGSDSSWQFVKSCH